MDSETVFIIWKRLSGHVALASWSEIAASLVGFVILLSFLRPHPPRVPGAPVHGYKSKWEPSLFLKWRYVFASNEIIAQGYRKVSSDKRRKYGICEGSVYMFDEGSRKDRERVNGTVQWLIVKHYS